MNKKLVKTLILSSIIGTNILFTNSAALAYSNDMQNNTPEKSIVMSHNLTREAGSFIVTARSGANLRTGPGLNYRIITAFPKGTELWRVNCCPTNGWYKVTTADNRYTGWIHESTGFRH